MPPPLAPPAALTPTTMLDLNKIRAEFPVLTRQVYGRRLIYLDNTATAQTPRQVTDMVQRMYTEHHANVHRGVHCLSQEATDLLERTRADVARWINAPSPEQCIFTRGTTEGLNLAADSYCRTLPQGSEIIVTVMDHHSNIVPWQLAAERNSLTVKAIPVTERGELDLEEYRRMFTAHTRVVAFPHVSNVLGTVNPVREICRIAHDHGCIAVVDGAQAVPHYKVDVQALDADLYAFSAHKMYGPTGVGVLYGRREILEGMPPYQGGGEMIDHVSLTDGTTFAPLPFKFEAGTPDYTAIPALSEAIRFIDSIGIDAIEEHEMNLYNHTVSQLCKRVPQVRIFGNAPLKCPVLSFLIGNAHAYDTGMLLDKLGIAVRTGHHCAQPLMQRLGIVGCARASFGVYNTIDEADAFVEAVARIAPMLS